jgi:hypothetical protein
VAVHGLDEGIQRRPQVLHLKGGANQVQTRYWRQ